MRNTPIARCIKADPGAIIDVPEAAIHTSEIELPFPSQERAFEELLLHGKVAAKSRQVANIRMSRHMGLFISEKGIR